MDTKKKILDQIIVEGQKKRPELEPDLIDQFFRMISRYVSLVLIRLKFTPNSVTSIAILCSIIGGFFLAHGNINGYLTAAFCFFLFLLFDYCDGEMARTLGKNSISGHYLDYIAHFIMFASFMVGLSFGIYQYHPTNPYLILGLCGVSGILLKSITELLISEVIIRENLRIKKLLPFSNKDADYSFQPTTVDDKTIISGSNSYFKKFRQILLMPSSGDAILFFYIPFSVIIFTFPYPIVNEWNIRLVDIYFFYLCLVNMLLPLLLIYRNVYQKRAELAYNKIWGNQK